MGPYPVKRSRQNIIGHVYETNQLFELYGFHTLTLVCDGAGPKCHGNQNMIAAPPGAYGNNSKPGESQPLVSLNYPFNPPNNIYWVIYAPAIR